MWPVTVCCSWVGSFVTVQVRGSVVAAISERSLVTGLLVGGSEEESLESSPQPASSDAPVARAKATAARIRRR